MLDKLKLLADGNRVEDRNTPGDYVRFELLMDVLQEVANPGLRVLSFLEHYTEPNALHFPAASARTAQKPRSRHVLSTWRWAIAMLNQFAAGGDVSNRDATAGASAECPGMYATTLYG